LVSLLDYLVEERSHLASEVGTWGEEVQKIQNVPRSAWVKTDAASKTANATYVETHTLTASVFTHALRGTFCTSCTSGSEVLRAPHTTYGPSNTLEGSTDTRSSAARGRKRKFAARTARSTHNLLLDDIDRDHARWN
jgi:hypothetical protein